MRKNKTWGKDEKRKSHGMKTTELAAGQPIREIKHHSVKSNANQDA